ncbi:PDZ domain-containing protein [Streptomyces sp. WSLK1-5]|uniref:PDZ domain-containing protein n=1 Tax=unclassified Streptomyces TaxID=2593676 RepID=UPI00378C4EC4
MEQTALRPKPMPGQEPGEGRAGGGGGKAGPVRRPHAARRRGRRLTTLLFGLLVAAVLVLSGVGLGTVGATVIGMSKLAELRRHAGPHQSGSPGARHPDPAGSNAPRTTPVPPVPAVATLGLEAVDAEKTGALVVGVHVPGPGYAAGLVRGDVVLALGRTRVDGAEDLARAVAKARVGHEVVLTVRHRGGGHQQLTAVPGVVM